MKIEVGNYYYINNNKWYVEDIEHNDVIITNSSLGKNRLDLEQFKSEIDSK